MRHLVSKPPCLTLPLGVGWAWLAQLHSSTLHPAGQAGHQNGNHSASSLDAKEAADVHCIAAHKLSVRGLGSLMLVLDAVSMVGLHCDHLQQAIGRSRHVSGLESWPFVKLSTSSLFSTSGPRPATTTSHQFASRRQQERSVFANKECTWRCTILQESRKGPCAAVI